MLTVADVLERAADLIEPDGAWVKGELGYDADGNRIPDREVIHSAVCFCVAGAIWRAADVGADDTIVWDAFKSLGRSANFRTGVGPWNDKPERTQPEVVAALRRAATLARAGDA
ncbi:hypothetical protein C8J45_103330 [Sphingomonas sp. PP-CE-3G-477]|uniref:DUF6197 family protein n=1 Tax=Sphingomonas sp. PP-CE-3G-477 TaxID=2135660 RepID=UPI000D391300|nr:hypothetical protein [Sphingomonas sp. PP-CE-3G-477]PTQ64480.1 hypothetical protein C8J45_103330 [Sphingomonas sp. PP-CE-3G-477]